MVIENCTLLKKSFPFIRIVYKKYIFFREIKQIVSKNHHKYEREKEIKYSIKSSIILLIVAFSTPTIATSIFDTDARE